MLELKLAMYIDFPKKMKPGIFVSSADCIELYELNGEEWNFENPGVTSLAHPSPIEIGTTHGVYVLDEPVEEIVKEVWFVCYLKRIFVLHICVCSKRKEYEI